MTRALAAALMAAVLAATAAGCGGGGNGENEVLTVYVSLPLKGERAAEGRAVRRGALDALSQARGTAGGVRVRAVILDDTADGRWSPVATAANARSAVEDTSSIAYIGDIDDGATRTSLPITNEASILQVSPGSTAVDLTRHVSSRLSPELYRPRGDQTFVRLVPNQDVIDRGPEPRCGPGERQGSEAMSLVLDSIAAAGGRGATRSKVVEEATSADRRDTALGDYRVEDSGDTTLTTIAC